MATRRIYGDGRHRAVRFTNPETGASNTIECRGGDRLGYLITPHDTSGSPDIPSALAEYLVWKVPGSGLRFAGEATVDADQVEQKAAAAAKKAEKAEQDRLAAARPTDHEFVVPDSSHTVTQLQEQALALGFKASEIKAFRKDDLIAAVTERLHERYPGIKEYGGG